MMDVLDSFSRKQAESAELIRSANAKARIMRHGIDQIAAWSTRDDIRQTRGEVDTAEYLLSSIEFITRIAEDALAGHGNFQSLVKDGRVKREQLYNDAEELLGYEMIGPSEFESIRELDIQLLLMGQCADDGKLVHEQAVDVIDDLRARERKLNGQDGGQVAHSETQPAARAHERHHFNFVVVTESKTIH